MVNQQHRQCPLLRNLDIPYWTTNLVEDLNDQYVPTDLNIHHQPLHLHQHPHHHAHSLLFKGLPIGGAKVLFPAGLPGSTPDAKDAELAEFLNCPILDCLPAIGSS